MAQKPIREYCAKKLIQKHWDEYFPNFEFDFKSVLISSGNMLKEKTKENTWLNESGLVVKPDMLFGKRGLNKLVFLKDKKPGDINIDMAAKWIDENSSKETILICGSKGTLSTFIVEPFQAYDEKQEYYLSFATSEDHDIIYISAHGGVNVEDNWDKVIEIKVPLLDQTKENLLKEVQDSLPNEINDKKSFSELTASFYQFFKELHFSYLEFNPIVLQGNKVQILDVVARIDDTARYLVNSLWGSLEFPRAFGTKKLTEIEEQIQKADENSGASLKLTILNPKGLVWTLVAGGGASVVYADSIANLWGAKEIANYGEYSGNPTKDETYLYAKGVLDLMTQEKDPQGRSKVLIIGGSIANFTDVAKTFDGIIQAFNEMHQKMKDVKVSIFVRRGGPNYEIGLKNIENAAITLNLPIEVYGPETHLTDIVRKAQLRQKQGVK